MILPDNHLVQLRIQAVGEFYAEPFGARLEPNPFIVVHWSLEDIRTESNLGNTTFSVEMGTVPASLIARAWRSTADGLCVSHPIQSSLL